MAGFSELVKNFDKTRDYIRDFFIYGYKVRNEFTSKSSRTYDDEKRRTESWLGDTLRYDNTQRGRQVSISVDSGHIYENPLYNAFWSKSFTDNDIKLHFMLCDILKGCSMNVREITEKLNADYSEVFEEQTVRNKLREYSQEGIIIRSRQGKTDFFTLSEDSVESFTEKFRGLDDAVKFFSGTSPFGVIGSSILRAAGIKNDIFLNKHNYIVHTLEDEILIDILDMIKRKRTVTVSNFCRRGETSDYTGTPLRILVSAQTGRRYLVIYLPQYRRFNSFRLDHIKSVKDNGVSVNFDNLLQKLNENQNRCFGVSFGQRNTEQSGGKISITFEADEEKESHIIQRLCREKRCGKISRTAPGQFTFTADVFDISEIMHWVKSFTGRIISIDTSNQYILKRFYSDINRMNRMYNRKEARDEDIQ